MASEWDFVVTVVPLCDFAADEAAISAQDIWPT